MTSYCSWCGAQMLTAGCPNSQCPEKKILDAIATEDPANNEARHSHRERAGRLEAKVERLKLQWTAMKSEVQLCHRKIEATEAENAKLREALNAVRLVGNSYAVDIARAALRKPKP
jgi:chromosome segregation ATPase